MVTDIVLGVVSGVIVFLILGFLALVFDHFVLTPLFRLVSGGGDTDD